MDTLNNVNEKVKKRLGLEAPCKLLVEQYLIEIAKNFNVAYEPDQLVMIKSGIVDENLISLREKTDDIVRRNNNNNGGGGGATGGGDSGGFSASHNLIGFDTSEVRFLTLNFNIYSIQIPIDFRFLLFTFKIIIILEAWNTYGQFI